MTELSLKWTAAKTQTDGGEDGQKKKTRRRKDRKNFDGGKEAAVEVPLLFKASSYWLGLFMFLASYLALCCLVALVTKD